MIIFDRQVPAAYNTRHKEVTMIIPPLKPAFTTMDVARFFDTTPEVVKRGALSRILKPAQEYARPGRAGCYEPEEVRRVWKESRQYATDEQMGPRIPAFLDHRWVPWTFGAKRRELAATSLHLRLNATPLQYWPIDCADGISEATTALQRNMGEIIWAVHRGLLDVSMAFEDIDGPARLFLLGTERLSYPDRGATHRKTSERRKPLLAPTNIESVPEGDKALSMSQVASALDVPSSHVYKLCYSKRLKCVALPGDRGASILLSDLNKFIGDEKRMSMGTIRRGRPSKWALPGWAPKVQF